MKKSIIVIIVISILSLLLLCGGIYWVSSKGLFNLGGRNDAATTENLDSDDSNVWSVPCNSVSGSTVESGISGYDISVQVAEIYAYNADYFTLEASTRRTFSIADFQDVYDGDPPYSAFVNLNTDDGRSETGIDVEFQLCNEDNMSNREFQGDYDVENNERPGVSAYLHGSQTYIPTEPGNYRFDGYVYLDGEWYLMGQIELVFTE